MTAPALINVLPKKAKRGDIVEIRTMISHPMETGFRRNSTGEAIPRDIITAFTCLYDGVEVFRADLFPAMTANPFLVFHTVAVGSGTLAFKWTGDNGFSAEERAKIEVE